MKDKQHIISPWDIYENQHEQFLLYKTTSLNQNYNKIKVKELPRLIKMNQKFNHYRNEQNLQQNCQNNLRKSLPYFHNKNHRYLQQQRLMITSENNNQASNQLISKYSQKQQLPYIYQYSQYQYLKQINKQMQQQQIQYKKQQKHITSTFSSLNNKILSTNQNMQNYKLVKNQNRNIKNLLKQRFRLNYTQKALKKYEKRKILQQLQFKQNNQSTEKVHNKTMNVNYMKNSLKQYNLKLKYNVNALFSNNNNINNNIYNYNNNYNKPDNPPSLPHQQISINTFFQDQLKKRPLLASKFFSNPNANIPTNKRKTMQKFQLTYHNLTSQRTHNKNIKNQPQQLIESSQNNNLIYKQRENTTLTENCKLKIKTKRKNQLFNQIQKYNLFNLSDLKNTSHLSHNQSTNHVLLNHVHCMTSKCKTIDL